MIETVLGFFAGVLLTPWAFGVLFVICWIFEHNEWRFWSTVLLGGVVFIACKIFYVPQPWLNYGLFAYLPVGFGWSFWRWLRHCSTVSEEAVAEKERIVKYNEALKKRCEENPSYGKPVLDEFYVDHYKDKIKLRYNLNKITYWILIWPLSLIDMILGDIYDVIKHFVKNVCGRGYKKIAEKYMKKIDSLVDPIEETAGEKYND